MTEHQTLRRHLDDWAGADEPRQAVANTLNIIADTCCAIAEIIAMGPLTGGPGVACGGNTDGGLQTDGGPQKELDARATEILIEELQAAPVAYVASEDLEDPLAIKESAALYVAIDPLDGSSNIDTNVSVGTIFSVMPVRCAEEEPASDCCLQSGGTPTGCGLRHLWSADSTGSDRG